MSTHGKKTRGKKKKVVRVPEDCTLEKAVERVHRDERLTTIVVGKGEHQIDGNYLEVSSAMNIVGDPGVAKSEIMVVGGIRFNKGIPGNCHLQHLTLRQAKGSGVFGWSSFTMEDVMVEQCGFGVYVTGTVVVRCTNVEVRRCEENGVGASMGASITLIGAKTTVHHNCTKGDSGSYGLEVYDSSSTIQLVSPLTKEQVSIDNGGGGNWGAEFGGDIHQIKTVGVPPSSETKTTEEGVVRVPEDCKTLNEAVGKVHLDDRLTTIVVGKGEHHIEIDGYSLEIPSAMNIVGDPGVSKSEIVVVGGILVDEDIDMSCLKHLTLRRATENGVEGYSSFTMEDVLVEQCGENGVCAVVGYVQCTDVEVRQCGFSGVRAHKRASITLIGDKTTVHHNCTKGESDDYGLEVSWSHYSTIRLVSPLTKEQVSLNNGGGGNWGVEDGGDINQIKTTGGEVRVPEDCKTLNEAVGKVHLDDRLTTIVVGKGEHHIEIDGYSLEIPSAMNIVGDPGVSKSEIVVVGGILVDEDIDMSCLKHLTLRRATENGVEGYSSFTMEDVLVEQCGENGVCAVVGYVQCTDVEVRQCGFSGVRAHKRASITLIGDKTTVHHNCTKGESDDYGLEVSWSHYSTIRLVSPLTKEQVSLNNGGGGNWGAGEGGDIHQIKTIAKSELGAAARGEARGEVRVPEDCKTLEEAVDRVRHDGLTTIIVGKGEHQINGDYLEIVFAMNIVGDPAVSKSEIVVVGGIKFEKRIPGNCHLQHLTLRQAKRNGVFGWSSFTMKDVLVEQCGYGVVAYGTVVGRCTNVEVRQCGWTGVCAADGASITLTGAKTTVHHNCTKGDSDDYGLAVSGSSSSIQLVSPLTKETVSIYNGGGGNWGAEHGGNINQIRTMTEAEVVRWVEIAKQVNERRATIAAVARKIKAERKVKKRKAARKAMRERVAEMSETSIRAKDFTTLQEAVNWVHNDNSLTTILVEKGEYQIEHCGYLMILSAMNIVGDPGDPGEEEWVPKSEIVIRGGVQFAAGIQGMCHLQHLTLHKAKLHGVLGWSSFTMEDVLVKKCRWSGVCAYGPVVARCTNVEVRKCGRNGVRAFDGASITLVKTTVHDNCKYDWVERRCTAKSWNYGLKALGGTIKLVSLTKGQVSYDNGGGGNWNTQINDIEEITFSEFIENMNQILAKQLQEIEGLEDDIPQMELVDAPGELGETDFKLRF